MSYFDLNHRVLEVGAVEPKTMTWLYGIVVDTPVVRALYRRLVQGVLSLGVSEGFALDLGTGPGYLSVAITRKLPALRMVGMDLAYHMVERARRNAERAGLDGRGFWPQGDAHRLPFADATFQLVFSSFSLHHWADPLGVLNEIARVLAPGGCYYIVDLCREVNWLQRLFAYSTIPVLSVPFGSYRGYGGYYESVRAAHSRAELSAISSRSTLPPGVVALDSTWFAPVVTLASKVM
jgi:ubiquinone/menaquinone biosynthesis C-methylase UbiE